MRQFGHLLGSFTKPLALKNSCSPAEKTNVLPQSRQVRSLFENSIYEKPNCPGDFHISPALKELKIRAALLADNGRLAHAITRDSAAEG